ncbi:TraX family protein [Terasakiispira papahanaumokuakeensis]|nr:TraX family protein [Terasakiispira papahanaumokuakeensis]
MLKTWLDNDTAEATKDLDMQASPQVQVDNRWSLWGQWLAMITMTLDHGVRFWPGLWPDLAWVSSSFGRVAFPLFAFMVAWHGTFNTRDPLHQSSRILLIGLLAQLPFVLLPRSTPTEIWDLNVCFTLAAGLALSEYVIRVAHQWRRLPIMSACQLVAMLAALVFLGPLMDYGMIGIVVLIVMRLGLLGLRDGHKAQAGLLLLVPVIAGLLNSSVMAKSITVATCVVLILIAWRLGGHIPKPQWRVPRWLWRSWYPLHLALLAVVSHIPAWMA